MRNLDFESDRNFKIYIIKNDWTLHTVAVVVNSRLIFIESGNKIIDTFNKKVCERILNDKGYNSNFYPPVIKRSSDIIGIEVASSMWRRATTYQYLQFSDRGHRYLSFATDEVKHSATSFGTDLSSVLQTDSDKMIIKHSFQENYSRILNLAEDYYPHLEEKIRNMNNFLSDINTNFGI